MELIPQNFIDEQIIPIFNAPQMLEKTPSVPNGFIWRGDHYQIMQLLAEWTDFRRRGKMGRNMRPEHAARALLKGSWGVGRFYFRVEVNGGRLFELYYDRAPEDAFDRKGRWILRSELSHPSINIGNSGKG